MRNEVLVAASVAEERSESQEYADDSQEADHDDERPQEDAHAGPVIRPVYDGPVFEHPELSTVAHYR